MLSGEHLTQRQWLLEISMQQVMLEGNPHIVAAVMHTQFFMNTMAIGVHCFHRDAQLLGNLRPTEPARDALEYGSLARTEHVEP